MTVNPTNGPVGVLVMAYGTPASADDVEDYYTHIRRGRPPTPEQLANLQARYDALGGTSTLAARTADQVAGITTALHQAAPDQYVVTLGQKHASPFVEDGVAELVAAGADRIVGLVLAPHFSAASVGQYHDRASESAMEAGAAYSGIERWYDRDAYHRFLVAAVRDGLGALSDRARAGEIEPAGVEVVFTAHSLPERVLVDDPYAHELLAGARRVAEELGLDAVSDGSTGEAGGVGGGGPTWSVGWQSAGATPEPWRGPDILEVIREVAASGRADALLVCPQGFVADHLEVAYDLDIEATRVASEAGIAFGRTRTLNDHPSTLADLAALIHATATTTHAPPEPGGERVATRPDLPQERRQPRSTS